MFLRSRISAARFRDDGCVVFKDPGYRWGRFRDDGWGYPTTMQGRPPPRHPGLAPGPRLVSETIIIKSKIN